MKTIAIVWLLMLLAATSATAGEPDAEALVDWVSGSFSSAAQAAADSTYYDIRLEMAPIWTDRDDALWIYVEQAVAGMTDRPYRQRVYRVSQGKDGVFASAVYAISEVTVSPGMIKSWDRGFDAEGNQVWGAEKGAYVFVRNAE